MAPSAFVVLDALPLTPNGKIDRRALPEPERVEPERPYTAPRTPEETTLADIWADVLHVERVGVHDNFFELGGDSILGLQMLSRAGQAGMRLVPRQLYQHQTVAELAAAAEAWKNAESRGTPTLFTPPSARPPPRPRRKTSQRVEKDRLERCG